MASGSKRMPRWRGWWKASPMSMRLIVTYFKPPSSLSTETWRHPQGRGRGTCADGIGDSMLWSKKWAFALLLRLWCTHAQSAQPMHSAD